jgi:O-antigen ligase
MGIINKAQKFSIYLFLFSLNFESINLFNLGIDYLATKISISVLLFFSLLNFKKSFTFKNFPNVIKILVLYILMLIVNNFINQNVAYNTIINVSFFLNVLVFIVLCNYAAIDKYIILKGLLVFSLSSFCLTILFLFGLGEISYIEGRFSIFGMNENGLGLALCISIFILIAIVFDNKLFFNKGRYLLLVMIPFLFFFLLQTGSRGALISLTLGLGTYFILNNKLKHIYKIVLFLVILFSSLFIWEFFLRDSVITARLMESINNRDVSSRDLVWKSIYIIIADNTMFGIGETGYAQKMDNFSEYGVASPHNVFLEIFCYTGLVGLVIFLFFLKNIFVAAREVFLNKGEILSIVLLFPLANNLLSGQLLDVKMLWVILAFIASRDYTGKKENIHMQRFKNEKDK